MRDSSEAWRATAMAAGAMLIMGLVIGLSSGTAEAAIMDSPLPPSDPLLTLFLSALPYPGVEAGGVVTYTITVVNEGGDAAQVVIADCLPTLTTFLSPLTLPAPQVGQHVAWWDLGPLAGNGEGSASVAFTVQVFPDAPTDVELVNRVVATADDEFSVVADLVHLVNRIPAVVTPDEATQIVAPVNNLRVAFPRGAVSETVQITMTIMTTPTEEAGVLQLMGKVFFLDAVGENGDAVTSFLRPYTLTVGYEDAWWQEAGLQQEEDLNLLYWEAGQWKPILPCPGCWVDTEANQVVAVLDHFTEFALGQTQKVHLPLIWRR